MHEVIDQHFVEGIMRNNDEIAEHNHEHFDELGFFTINLMSAPGAGKTTLLAATIPALRSDYSAVVIEGDMVGELDADRLRAQNIISFQISTGRSCHLDASMIDRLLHTAPLSPEFDFLFIENVGNLVCPAEFPLGEHQRVVLLSVTEGADKPLKYPVIFRNCDAVIFTKSDLLPYVDFDLDKAIEYVHDINPNAQTFAVSVKNGDGLQEWFSWLKSQIRVYKESHVHLAAR